MKTTFFFKGQILLAAFLFTCAAVKSQSVTLVKQSGATITYSTIQEAVMKAEFRDVIEISGTFTQTVHIKNKMYLTIRKAPSATSKPVISSSKTFYNGWIQSGSNYYISMPTYTMSSDFTNRKAALFATMGDPGSGQVLTTYSTLGALSNRSNGIGIYHDYFNNRIYANLGTGVNPNSISGGITVGLSEAIICIENSNNIIIEDIELRNAGWAGIYIKGGEQNHHITLNKINIKNSFRGISTDTKDTKQPSYESGPDPSLPSSITITNCSLTNNISEAFTKTYAYNSTIGGSIINGGIQDEEYAPHRGKAIFIKGNYILIYNNYLRGHFDGIGYQGSNTNILNNTIELIFDDAIELESTVSSDVRFYRNYVFNAFTGVSLVSQSPGRISVYRNVLECTRFDPIDGAGQGIKMGKNWACKAENVRIYHNTVFGGKYSVYEKFGESYQVAPEIGSDNSGLKTSTCPGASNDLWTNFKLINNIFFVHSGATNNRGTGGFKGINYNFRGIINLVDKNLYYKAADDKARLQFTTKGTNRDNLWEGNLYNGECPMILNTNVPVDPEISANHLALPTIFIQTGLSTITSNQKRDLKLRTGVNSAVNQGSWYAYDNSFSDGAVTYNKIGVPNDRPDKGAWELGATYTIGKYEFDVFVNSYTREESQESGEKLIKETELARFVIFPNPAQHQLTILLENITTQNLILFDVFGKKVAEIPNPQGATEIHIDLEILHLASGIYFVKREEAPNEIIGKFLKQE